jgi:DNA polymerase elongation subunit (family B)
MPGRNELASPNDVNLPPPTVEDWVYGWDETPGIVSIWADRDGQALVWRRDGDRVRRESARFRPWLFAAHVEDLAHLRVTADDGAPISATPLDGPVDSYRYLISARSGRALENALLVGARRRLGQPVASLYDLDDYYRVGPVEQYLMSSGRVYFRGMRYADLHRMQIDLETTSLDPADGRIFMVAVSDSSGLATTLEAPAPEDEAELVAALCRLVRERDPDVIENHNLFGFDLPFLAARAEALRVPLLLGRAGAPSHLERIREDPRGRRHRYSVAGRELLDTLDAVRRHDFVARDMPSHGLKDVARYFGVAGPERTYLAGAQIYATYQRDPETVRRYALDDVAEVQALSPRLLAAPFALVGMAPRRYERVAWAGPAMGILEPMLLRAYLRARQAPPLPAAARGIRTDGHVGGALFLFAGGVARNVVKADIASLYPSLMRAYSIGPACDRLGAFVGIVGHVLQARLGHKAAARLASAGSLEAGHHHALQAAMKLIVNAAYGYMGATSMALFGDMDAADEVTRRGREVLGAVIEGLRARGVALIEADTDGVYFAVPPAWGEAEERALVAAVAAELPAGITLEYEGRYQAMFSHEVKNYALLTYDGQLIMRGVAMRSSRSEPFGERFLRGAMRHTMAGDSAALREYFLACVAELRERRLPASAVATRVRLSKSPEQYRAGRQREGQYEAMLAAGRSSWEPGERVRFYRAEGGRFVLLPDDGQRRDANDHSLGDHDEGRKTKDEILNDEVLEDEADVHDPKLAESPSTFVPRPSSPPDYDAEHYVRILLDNYAGRLKKAFRPEDFAQIFRLEPQLGLFDRDLAGVEPRWIRPEPH